MMYDVWITSIFSCMHLWMREGKVTQIETNVFHWFLDIGGFSVSTYRVLGNVYSILFLHNYVFSTKWIIFIRRCLWFIALCMSVLFFPGGSNEQEFSHAILIRRAVCVWDRLFCMWTPLFVGCLIPMLRVLYSGSGILNNYPVEELLCLRW